MKIVRAIRNWIFSIVLMSVFFGIVFSVVLFIPISIVQLIKHEALEIKDIFKYFFIFSLFNCIVLTVGIIIRILIQLEDIETRQKIKSVNDSRLTDALSNFSKFFI